MNQIKLFSVKQAGDGVTRHEQHDGRGHLVVPVVMICEGVLNEALLTADEFGRYAESWNGRPVPVLHPEQNGQHISANSPRVLEQTIGKLFNTHIDAGKLKTEAWLDTEKATALGFGPMLATLEAGEQGMEVSTGYWSDAEPVTGVYNGVPYTHIDRNIRPDHLALLPGEIGACSWADGCGVRANKGFAMKTKDAMNTLIEALGLKTKVADCDCNPGGLMADEESTAKRIDALKANEQITPKQLTMIQDMDEEQQKMMLGIIQSMLETAPAEEPEPADPETPPEDAALEANTDAKLKAMVDEAMRRGRVTEKLVANEACMFDEAELTALPVAHLEKLEQSIRPADYSGQGGFAANSDVIDNEAQPLTVHRGVLAQPKKEA